MNASGTSHLGKRFLVVVAITLAGFVCAGREFAYTGFFVRIGLAAGHFGHTVLVVFSMPLDFSRLDTLHFSH